MTIATHTRAMITVQRFRFFSATPEDPAFWVRPPPNMSVRVLYGGSVSSKNAVELITEPDVDGFLIGGLIDDVGVVFGMVFAAFRVPHDHIAAAQMRDHIRGDIAGEDAAKASNSTSPWGRCMM